MASLTIRNLDDGLKQSLRLRAAGKGRSMEEEARQIIRSAVGVAQEASRESFATRVNRRFRNLDAEEVVMPLRRIARAPADLGDQ